MFSDFFDPRANGLNFIRLILAVSVIIWHAVRLSGHDIEFLPVRRLVSETGVDGFFAISGYLIVSSWVRTPDWKRFLRARILRIMPAFWVCLAATALIFAPAFGHVFGAQNFSYIYKNSVLWIFQYDIAGTPTGVPYDGVWNGSLWTLYWEFLCYLGVLVLGLTGLIKRRWALPVCFSLALLGLVLTTFDLTGNSTITLASRFGVMFLAGALIWQFQEKIKVSAPLVATALVVVLASSFLPDYRLVAALPLAYLVITAGAAIRSPQLRLKNDISYGVYIYAFPVQQILAIWGAYHLGIGVYALLAIVGTVPLAMLSWFWVEKPAIQLNRRLSKAIPTN